MAPVALKKIPTLLTIILLFLSGYGLGYLHGHRNLVLDESLVPKLVNTELRKPAEVDFSLFWEAWKTIDEKFAGTIDVQKKIYGAIKGMVSSLGDPYTVFLEPSENDAFLKDLSGIFEGIGAEIGIRGGELSIVAPLEGSPAERAGLLPKDLILEIDGESTQAMTLDSAVQKIRGKSGTKVTLLISREGFPEPKEFTITRQKITVDSVRLEFKENNIAYIKIIQFGADTGDRIKQVADELKSKNSKGIVLDLRNNPGGFLNTALDVASVFVKEEVISLEEDKDGRRKELGRTFSATLDGIPMVVLVNEGSASASEIVGGALQDYGRAKLVGKKTFGKGSVQDLEDLKGGSALKVTIAKWLTPKGRQINGEGIAPDVEVDRTEADINADRDPQLDKGLELLK
jgi:carboxyl-terminal processing protease